MKHLFYLAGFVMLGCILLPRAECDELDASRALLKRIIPERASSFIVEQIPRADNHDVFEIESRDNGIVLRGNNGIAIASAFNWYLGQYCNAAFTLWGNQPVLPDPLPVVSFKVRIVTPLQYRYCFNYCCFSYSMAWWDWSQWERAIDWMALHGINMPLSVTGQEAVWQSVYHALGLTDAELNDFFVGPAYLPFGWMGCMDGWGGPLSQHWIDSHKELEQQILQRERELGMTPVLQGFTGHVPAALKNKFPEAQFKSLPKWCDFPGTLFIDPQDPLFIQIGKAFIEEQTRLYGTDHLYGSDTFIEMSPPSDAPEFLAAMGSAVYNAMTAGDPAATWVMQGWLFVNNPSFWKPPQAKALLNAVPNDRMILLDLYCEVQPVWSKTEAFYGKPWIWCIIHSFGNQVCMHAGLPQIATGFTKAMRDSARGNLCGSGFIMEGLSNDAVVYDLLSELSWQPVELNLDEWIVQYSHSRYGRALPRAESAWKTFLHTVYKTPAHTGSCVTARPDFDGKTPWSSNRPAYKNTKLLAACKDLLACREQLQHVDTYQYDVVHAVRQLLANYANTVPEKIIKAFMKKDTESFHTITGQFIELLNDMDALLSTRSEFLLGKWQSDAVRWAQTPEEQAHYRWNARNQITLWGPKDSGLHEYACKQWAGLIKGFYAPRWNLFFEALNHCLETNTPFDPAAFDQQIKTFDDAWTHGAESYSTQPIGNPVEMASKMLEKYERLVRFR